MCWCVGGWVGGRELSPKGVGLDQKNVLVGGWGELSPKGVGSKQDFTLTALSFSLGVLNSQSY